MQSPYHPLKGDGTIWVLSYAKAAEDSSAVMDGPEESAHGRLDGQKGRGEAEETEREKKRRQKEHDKTRILRDMKSICLVVEVSMTKSHFIKSALHPFKVQHKDARQKGTTKKC